MKTNPATRPRRPAGIITPVALGLLIAVAVTACGPGHAAAKASAGAAASSALANPTISADISAVEAALLANYKKDFSPAHPVTSLDTAIKATFPAGDTAAIEKYAVAQFTTSDITSRADRDAWAAKVAGYASGATASPSPSASMAAFTPAASPSASKS